MKVVRCVFVLSFFETPYIDYQVERFVQYCKGELDYEALGMLHQPSEEYVEDLRAKPWWEPEEFEWISKLEEKSDVVIDEFAAFWNDPKSSFARDSKAMDIMGKGWSGVRLQRLGDWIPENCGKFPNTVTLLKELEIPLAVRGVMFARQVPGSGVSPHSDGRNFILTTHLGEAEVTVGSGSIFVDEGRRRCLCWPESCFPFL